MYIPPFTSVLVYHKSVSNKVLGSLHGEKVGADGGVKQTRDFYPEDRCLSYFNLQVIYLMLYTKPNQVGFFAFWFCFVSIHYVNNVFKTVTVHCKKCP